VEGDWVILEVGGGVAPYNPIQGGPCPLDPQCG